MTVKIALAGMALLTAFALPSLGRAQSSTATATVDVMNQLWGRHPHQRANHAKGVVVTGHFVPSEAARGLSKASIFAGDPVPVEARFSDSTGIPNLADASDDAAPHGLGIRFRTRAGGAVDVVLNSLAFFPVRTGEEFLQLLEAITKSPPGTASPTPLEAFIGAHPAVPAALSLLKEPVSFAREVYNGVDAFVLVDAAGARHPFRFKVVPVEGTEYMTPDQAKAAAPDVLVSEIVARIGAHPVVFHVQAQLAEPGDPIDDATKPWPAERRLVDLGTLTLDQVVPENEKAAEDLKLLPSQLEAGIEMSDDPLIMARVRSYVLSFGRRQ